MAQWVIRVFDIDGTNPETTETSNATRQEVTALQDAIDNLLEDGVYCHETGRIIVADTKILGRGGGARWG
jgi:hypothetical protein